MREECDGDQWRWRPANRADDQDGDTSGDGECANATPITAACDAQHPECGERCNRYEEEAAQRINVCASGADRRAGIWARECPIGEPGEEGPAPSGEDGEAAIAARRLGTVRDQEEGGQRANREAYKHHPVDEGKGSGDALCRHTASLTPACAEPDLASPA